MHSPIHLIHSLSNQLEPDSSNQVINAFVTQDSLPANIKLH